MSEYSENQKELSQTQIINNINNINQNISDAAKKASIEPQKITLVAVTKFHSASSVLAAYNGGVRNFGENRVQEASEKFTSLNGSIPNSCVYLLGHLQKNKVKKAVEVFDGIQSVDSIELIKEIAKRVNPQKKIELLFELHTGEESKTGFESEESLIIALEEALLHNNLCIKGLMTMAPFCNDEKIIRSSFAKCRELFLKIKSEYSLPSFNTLSMGMSNDYEYAIMEGSTMVRVGTNIFGKRIYNA